MSAPFRRVVSSRALPRSQRIELGDGTYLICGPVTYRDVLECGHAVTGVHRAERRRCKRCETESGQGQLFDAKEAQA